MAPADKLKLALKKALNKSGNVKFTAKKPIQMIEKKPSVVMNSIAKAAKQRNPPSGTKVSKLQEKMKKKLAGSEFRWINEKLYTSPSTDAVAMFKEQPELFTVYHTGFASQVESWPTNPNDLIIESLKSVDPCTVIVDMGCGEAHLSRSLPKHNVMSYDLVAASELIIACDIAHVPNESESVDIVIFCLSLMGTNLSEFLAEANRILKCGYSIFDAVRCLKSLK